MIFGPNLDIILKMGMNKFVFLTEHGDTSLRILFLLFLVKLLFGNVFITNIEIIVLQIVIVT